MGVRSRYEVEYRPASLPDALPIALMSRQHIEYGLPWKWRPIRVAQKIRQRDCTVLTARIFDQLSGFAMMHFGLQQAGLLLFAVAPEYRRQGVGRALLEWLEETARVAGVFTARLEVRQQNTGAIAMYKRLGYQIYKREHDYYNGEETAVCMYKDLRLI